jgi:hypothetical protein
MDRACQSVTVAVAVAGAAEQHETAVGVDDQPLGGGEWVAVGDRGPVADSGDHDRRGERPGQGE